MVSFEESEKIQKSKITLAQAKKILGDRAKWELQNMKKALKYPFFNTKEDEIRLKAVKVMLRSKK